jgi:hypothetical protein
MSGFVSNKNKAKRAERAVRFTDNAIVHLGERLRPMLDQLLVETRSAPRAHLVAEQIEALLLKEKIIRRTALPAPTPQRKRLAFVPTWVVKEAEERVERQWRQMPRAVHRKVIAAWQAAGGRHWQHPFTTALAEARKIACEDFRRKQAEKEAAPSIELPAHIRRMNDADRR